MRWLIILTNVVAALRPDILALAVVVVCYTFHTLYVTDVEKRWNKASCFGTKGISCVLNVLKKS